MLDGPGTSVYGIELSVLGATPQVNDDLMQVPGALERIKEAARRLRRRHLRVVLKATVLRPNAVELADMAKLAQDLDCTFTASPSVAPRRAGGDQPLQLALRKEELAALDTALMSAGPIPGEDTSGGAVLVCKAGRMVAGISPSGDVFPCIMWPRSVGNIRDRSLKDIWRDHPDPFLQQLRGISPGDVAECAACELRSYCRRCPGMAWQETGDATRKAESHCEAARGFKLAKDPP